MPSLAIPLALYDKPIDLTSVGLSNSYTSIEVLNSGQNFIAEKQFDPIFQTLFTITLRG